jgi:hypothetical protein
MNNVLIRVSEEANGTLGVWKIDGHAFCVTLEPPDLNNQPNISNIPPGDYIMKRYSSEKYPDTWEITGVPNRTKVLVHAGNKIRDTHGCVMQGETFGKLTAVNREILNSGNTFRTFMQITRHETTMPLKIIEV